MLEGGGALRLRFEATEGVFTLTLRHGGVSVFVKELHVVVYSGDSV